VYPARFVSAPQRNEAVGRPLRLVARAWTLDHDLLDQLGRGMFARDELGARLVAAMRREPGDPQRVTMAQFKRALADGIKTIPHPPAALGEFFGVVDRIPDWVDFDLLERGSKVFRRLGRSRFDVLLQLSLIGGYRFGGPPDLLVETGGLSGSSAMRRLGETQKWGFAVGQPGGMRREGEGFQLTLHVRLMHALINQRFESNGRWDIDRWGLPINQADQAATLGLFNSTLLLGVRLLGHVVTREASLALMHLWKYVGWLLGIDERWLFDTERDQNRFNYHVIRAQGDVTPAGAALARALVDGHFTRHRGPLGRVFGHYDRQRLLSMLSYFLGPQGMRDLNLPWTPPWAVPPIIAKNLLKTTLLARSGAGRKYLERGGERAITRELTLNFQGEQARIGALPT
jgi:hypothetical protein